MGLQPKERVLAAVQHQQGDHLPYTIGFEGDVAERLDAHYGSAAWRTSVDDAIRHVPPPPALDIDETAVPYTVDAYGSIWRVDHRTPLLYRPALQGPSLEAFVLPDVDALLTPQWREEALRCIEQQRGHFLVGRFSFGLFERTWMLRGFDEALMDAVSAPEFFDELVERVANHQLVIIERLLDLPVDGVMFSDDWGYQQGVILGPGRWRRFLKPRLARMYGLVHAAGKYVLTHCCGSVADIMPDLIEIGLDVLESVQPEAAGMNPYELKRRYGDRITFWGGLGSQSIIPFGSPSEIKEEVDRLCRKMGLGGGYILGPSKPLQPDTPTENAAAVVEAFLEHAGVPFPWHPC
jgi:uroporphyrinogen decarboxylase